jgi:hypothetical protein
LGATARAGQRSARGTNPVVLTAQHDTPAEPGRHTPDRRRYTAATTAALECGHIQPQQSFSMLVSTIETVAGHQVR